MGSLMLSAGEGGAPRISHVPCYPKKMHQKQIIAMFWVWWGFF